MATKAAARSEVGFDVGHSGAKAEELALYRRDESQSGLRQRHRLWVFGSTGVVWGSGFAGKAQARMVCRTLQGLVWSRRFPQPSGRYRGPHRVRGRVPRRSRVPLAQPLRRRPRPLSAPWRHRWRRRYPGLPGRGRSAKSAFPGSSHQSRRSGWPPRLQTSPRYRRARGRELCVYGFAGRPGFAAAPGAVLQRSPFTAPARSKPAPDWRGRPPR